MTVGGKNASPLFAEQKTQLLVSIVESSDDAIISHNLDGTITTWNRAAEKIFGYSAAEVIGQSIGLIIPVSQAEEDAIICDRIRNGDEVLPYDTVRRHKSGGLVEVSLSVSPIRERTGVVGAVKIARSIASRKAAERRVRAENAAIRAIAFSRNAVEAGHNIVVAICGETKWNSGAVWRVNPSRDRIVCVDFWSERASNEIRIFERETHGREFCQGDGLPGRVWKTGTPVWVPSVEHDSNLPRSPVMVAAGVRSACAVPVVVADAVAGVIEFFSAESQPVDDTFLQMMHGLGTHLGHFVERKRVEDELRAAQHRLQQQTIQLESTVQERTAELRQTLQSVESLCYTIAHDLRAPLRAMQGFARVLAQEYGEVLDETGRHYAQRIINASGRMDALITDLLAYGRLGTGDMTMLPVELDTAMDSFLADYSEEVKARHATICVERPLPVVMANPTLLGQVLANLLINAMKFVAPGVQPRVRVYSEEHGDRVRLLIQDNGIGIAPEHASKLFQVFQRLHGPDHYSGTGIGLAIVKKATEYMSGTAGFTSQPGQGCTFWIELPGGGAMPGDRESQSSGGGGT